MKKILQKIIKLNSFRVLVLSLALSVISTVFAFEARADLVDDLIKKHKLDPKNNPKDQCILMTEISRIVRGPGDDDLIEVKKYGSSESQIFRKQTKVNEKRSGLCLKDLCIAEIKTKGEKFGIDKYDAPWMIYRNNPFRVEGLDIGNYTVYDYYDKQKKIIESTYYLIGHSDNNKRVFFVQSNKISSKKNASYIKIHACSIEEYNLTNDHLYQLKITK